jgi:hypothetical protein
MQPWLNRPWSPQPSGISAERRTMSYRAAQSNVGRLGAWQKAGELQHFGKVSSFGASTGRTCSHFHHTGITLRGEAKRRRRVFRERTFAFGHADKRDSTAHRAGAAMEPWLRADAVRRRRYGTMAPAHFVDAKPDFGSAPSDDLRVAAWMNRDLSRGSPSTMSSDDNGGFDHRGRLWLGSPGALERRGHPGKGRGWREPAGCMRKPKGASS